MSEGKRVVIVLPDERRLELLVQPNLLSSDLLDLVTSQVALKEKEFFGLAFVDETGHYSWLHHERRVLDHEFPKKNPPPPLPPPPLPAHPHHQHNQANNKCAVVLYFLIKFYVESISLLRDSHTVEHFYLQLRSMVFKGQLEVGSESVYHLAARAIQAAYGDFVDEQTSRNHLKKLPVLPASALKEHQSLASCEDRVIEIYRSLAGQSRGQVIVGYLSTVESLPNYGVHYYEVKDKRNTPWWLGISYKGIAQYDYNDRRQPRRVFQWKQLENLYFRDRKFSIEVHDPSKRVLHAVSSLSVCPESPVDESRAEDDELSADSFVSQTQESQVSGVNRRSAFQGGTISVIVWFGQTQSLTKNIWHMAICQHQFYLDRRNSKSKQTKARNLSDIAVDLSKSSTSLSLSTTSSNSQSNLSHSGSTSSLNLVKMGQTPESEESEAAKAARLEIVAALKARKSAMEDKLKNKLEELKKLCLQEGELTGQLPPEFPLSPGEAPPTIRRRVGTSFTLPENLLNKAKSSKEESFASLELEYEIQRKITSAAFKLASDSTPSKAVRRQRKTLYQQSLQQLKDIETKLRTLRMAEAYNSTQAQPQVPVVSNSWHSKLKKKPRPNQDTTLDEEAGFIHNELEAHDLSYLDDPGVNLSPAAHPQQHVNHQSNNSAPNNNNNNNSTANNNSNNTNNSNSTSSNSSSNISTASTAITTTPLRRDRSLSPVNAPVANVRRPDLPRSAPASPSKVRQHPHANGYNGTHQHHHPMRANGSAGNVGYVPSSVFTRSSYRTKQYPTLSSGHATSPPAYLVKDVWDTSASSHNRVPSAALCPPLIGVDSTAGGGLYNIARQRASHDFPAHSSMDDLEVIGLRRLTGAPEVEPQSVAPDQNTPNTSADFEWDFGDENAPLRRLEHLVVSGSHPHHHQQQQQQQQHQHQPQHHQHQHHRFGSLDRRRRLMSESASKMALGSKSMDELDSSSPTPVVDVIDGSSIGPRFGGRGLRPKLSHSSLGSNGYNEADLTLLPNQTYPDYPDFGASYTSNDQQQHCSSGRMETTFDSDVYTSRTVHNMSTSSILSVSKKKEKDWYETSLDSPVPSRKNTKMTPPVPSGAPSLTVVPNVVPTSVAAVPPQPQTSGTSTVRAQPVRVAEVTSENGDGDCDYGSDDFGTDSPSMVVPYESPKNMEIISPGKWEPYREISKPFETSDIYKYSAKYRQQQQQQQQQHHSLSAGQVKGMYQPLMPMSCQPLNSARHVDGETVAKGGGTLKTLQRPLTTPAPSEFRSKPATLV